MTESDFQVTRIHCNKCGHETKHLTLLTRKQEGSDDVDFDGYHQHTISWVTFYDVFECCGCEDVSLRRRFHFSEWERDELETNYYPPRISRNFPKWKDELPRDIERLLEEVYVALHADSRVLAMMGARTLIDMVILDKVGDVGSFKKKLSELQSAGYLSDKNRLTLEAALEVGNAASHRGHRPTSKHVYTVMDIVENLMQSTILQSDTDDLKKATPKRSK
jgi:hypothetical protein